MSDVVKIFPRSFQNSEVQKMRKKFGRIRMKSVIVTESDRGTRPSKLLANCPGGRNFSFFRRHWSIGPQAGRRRWYGPLLSAVTRARGPLLSAVTQQRLRAPALGGTARCCRVLHLKMFPSFHIAKARTAVFHPEILQSVVRRLRTTHRILLPSDSTVCTFAPPEKRPWSVGAVTGSPE